MYRPFEYAASPQKLHVVLPGTNTTSPMLKLSSSLNPSTLTPTKPSTTSSA